MIEMFAGCFGGDSGTRGKGNVQSVGVVRKRVNNFIEMAKHIKNLQLWSHARVEQIAHQRFKHNDPKARVPELNFLKMFTRLPRNNSYSVKNGEDRQPLNREEQFSQEEQIILISTFKNTEATNDSPKRTPKPTSNLMTRYISDEEIGFARRTTQKDQLSGDRETESSNRQVLVICKDLPSLPDEMSTITKRTASGNRNLMKTKYRINNDFGKKSTKMGRAVSKNRLPDLNEVKMMKEVKLEKEKKYPVLNKDPDELKEIKSESYILVEYPSERIIVSNRAAVSLEIASLTKIMTFFTVMRIVEERGVDIRSEVIVVSPKVVHTTGTSADLVEGEEYTLQAMLYGLMLPSGNDAANELAYWAGAILSESDDHKLQQKAFVAEMNKNAKKLQLKNTNFANPHGLPHQQAKSTAADVAKLCCVCMKQEVFRTIVGCRNYKTTVKSGTSNRPVEWENTNKLLRREGFIGLKTGITVTAGPCLAAAYQFRDRTYISVILRAPKVSGRFKQTRLLLSWALTKLFKQSSENEKKALKKLRRHDHDLDSDNSEDEHEFKYDCSNQGEFKKRCNILNYEL